LVAAPPTLALAVLGGLARLGLVQAPAPAVAWHGPLLISGFFGTVIAVERATAVGGRAVWAAPGLAAAGAALLMAGQPSAGFAAFALGSALLAVAQVRLALAHRQAHLTWLAVGSALAVVGNALWWAGLPVHVGTPFALGFLIATILGERLELSRLVPRPALAPRLFTGLAGLFVVALGLGLAWPAAGAALAGLALVGLASWLARWDIARVTVRKPDLPGYVAVCLLSGYGWLAVGGAVWAGAGALRADGAWGDAALHALGLGFVMSMVFGHAPIILPAVTGLKVRFVRALYVGLTLLHLAVALRVSGALGGQLVVRQAGGWASALALLAFAAAMAWGVGAGRHRRRHRGTDTGKGDDGAKRDTLPDSRN
jgi:hypothetical protein